MELSRFFFVGLLVAVLGGCFEDDPPAAPDQPNEPMKPNDPNQPNDPPGQNAGPLQGSLIYARELDYEVHKFDLATGIDTVLGEGIAPSVAPDGKVVFVGKELHLEEASPGAWDARIIVKHDFGSAMAHDDNFDAPQVSPDGTKVAYTDLSRSMFVVDRATGEVVKSFEATGAQRFDRPQWMPDNRLVFAGGTENRGLFVTDTDLENPTRVDPDLDLNVAYPAEPALSRDGKKVAFRIEQTIQVMNFDGTDLHTITGIPDIDVRNPRFSPDGAFVAYINVAKIMIRPVGGGDAIELQKQYPDVSFGGMSRQFAWVP